MKAENVRKHGVRYPWGIWFGRKKFTLMRRRDFAGLEHGMAQTIRQAAVREGIPTGSLHIKVGDGWLNVTIDE